MGGKRSANVSACSTSLFLHKSECIFGSQVFNRISFGCTIVKATCRRKTVCGAETSSEIFASVLFISDIFLEHLPLAYSSIFFVVKIWGAGLCGWVGPVSPLEVLVSFRCLDEVESCGSFLPFTAYHSQVLANFRHRGQLACRCTLMELTELTGLTD